MRRLAALDALVDIVECIRPEAVVGIRPEQVIDTIVIGIGPEHRADKAAHKPEDERMVVVVVVLPPVVPRIRLGETAAEGRLRLRSICGIARRRELLPRILRELLRIGRPAGTGCGLRSGGHCAAGCGLRWRVCSLAVRSRGVMAQPASFHPYLVRLLNLAPRRTSSHRGSVIQKTQSQRIRFPLVL